MSKQEDRPRFSLEEAQKEADGRLSVIAHVVKNPEGDYSVMSHIVCEWCDYCTEQKSGIKIHDFKEDPYEIEEAGQREWDKEWKAQMELEEKQKQGDVPVEPKSPTKYSVPIYEDGVPTKWTVDFEEGDDKYNQFMALYSEIPMMINVRTKKENG